MLCIITFVFGKSASQRLEAGLAFFVLSEWRMYEYGYGRGAVFPAPGLGTVFEKRKTAGKQKPAVVLFGRIEPSHIRKSGLTGKIKHGN